MLINTKYIVNVDVICPSCNNSINIKDVGPIVEHGFNCTKCNYKTETGEEGLKLLIIAFLKQGKKIGAIKLYRAATKIGLKEAKEEVEKIAKEAGIELKDGCFIATACYGSDHAEHVILFKEYRDKVLLKSFLGKIFVKLYYKLSPFFADKIRKSERLKTIIRKYILSPIASIISL